MPRRDSSTINIRLTPGQWVLLEELWKEGFWVDNDRKLRIPDGVRISFRHNFMWPFWHWETGLGSGLHTFTIADGWNKYQARLETPGPATVQWLL